MAQWPLAPEYVVFLFSFFGLDVEPREVVVILFENFFLSSFRKLRQVSPQRKKICQLFSTTGLFITLYIVPVFS